MTAFFFCFFFTFVPDAWLREEAKSPRLASRGGANKMEGDTAGWLVKAIKKSPTYVLQNGKVCCAGRECRPCRLFGVENFDLQT